MTTIHSVSGEGIAYSCHISGRDIGEKAAILVVLTYMYIRKGRSVAQLATNGAEAVTGLALEMFQTLSCPAGATQTT